MVRSAKLRFDPTKDFDDSRDMPAYGLPIAAHYLRVPQTTLRYWVRGRKNQAGTNKTIDPVIHLPEPSRLILSFNNLAEAHVLSAFRKQFDISLPKVRRALRYVSDSYGFDHPLLTQDFATDGISLLIEKLGNLVDASAGGQIVIREALEGRLKRLERESEEVVGLYPFTRQNSPLTSPTTVLIDPRHSFGKPILVESRIATSVIAERYRAGESIKDLAYDYDCEKEEIEEAIRYELGLATAA